MRSGGPITEDDMVATFLRAEIASERFRDDVLHLLQRDGMPLTVVEQPDVTDPVQNAYRRRLLGDARGFGQNRALFEGFPAHVSWQRMMFTPAELLGVKYIDYSYWNALSNGTRSPTEAAKTIRTGRPIFGMSTEGFWRIAEVLRQGGRFPELIVVRAAADRELVVLEGHVRLTVYALEPELIPAAVAVLLGTSPAFLQWGAYGSQTP